MRPRDAVLRPQAEREERAVEAEPKSGSGERWPASSGRASGFNRFALCIRRIGPADRTAAVPKWLCTSTVCASLPTGYESHARKSASFASPPPRVCASAEPACVVSQREEKCWRHFSEAARRLSARRRPRSAAERSVTEPSAKTPPVGTAAQLAAQGRQKGLQKRMRGAQKRLATRSVARSRAAASKNTARRP